MDLEIGERKLRGISSYREVEDIGVDSYRELKAVKGRRTQILISIEN